MSASPAIEPQGWSRDWLAALAVVAAQVLATLHPEAIPLDSEELYNAAHGRMLQLGHLDALQSLQYRSYCGGCSLNALMSAGLFTALGPSLLAYKMVSMVYVGLAALLGARWLRLQVGPAAAVALVCLFVLAPPTWMELSLVAWGNHMEAGCLAVAAMVLTAWLQRTPARSTAIVLGLVLAAAGWIGFPSGFIGIAVAITLLVGRRWAVLPWVAVGALPLLVVWGLQFQGTHTSPFETIYYEGERLPQLSRVPEKIASLVAPRQLVALFGHHQDRIGWVLGWTWAAALAWAVGTALRAGRHGARIAVGFLGAFVVTYSLVRFTVWTPPAPHIAPPGSMRYAAPIYPLAFLILAAALGRAWHSGRRGTVCLVVLLVTGTGLRTRAAQFSAPFPSTAVLQTIGPDFLYFRDQASYTFPPEHHARCQQDDPDVQAVHGFGAGWSDARDLMSPNRALPLLRPPAARPRAAYFEGVGEWVRSQLDPRSQRGPEMLDEMASTLSALPEADRLVALQEAAWRRSTDWMRLALDGGPHTAATLERIAGLTRSLRPISRRATGHALGRRWALDVSRWADPRETPLPQSAWPTGFAHGLGVGIGERWGPEVNPSDWLEIPADEQSDFERGLRQGQQQRWISP